MMKNTKVFAHRGAAGTHPENTMIAFQEALRVGADGVELDVHLTKDNVPVVIHDETVNRTTNGSGWIKEYYYDDLRKLDAGSWFDEEFTGCTIPSLEEVLQWIAKTSLQINIELKNGIVRYENIEKIVIDLVHKYNLKDRVIISSFNHYSLVEVNKCAPEIETAILFMEGLYKPWEYAKTIGATGLHCYLPVAVPELLEGANIEGMPVRPFVVNEEKHIAALVRGGCSAIITDWPKQAIKILDNLK
ncbi:glycerophosphodiester phosphodiesterase [Sutcliffiella sp. NC1]|uniref:glycerophosphodiester phosphodiesterase n=1 Tax=Sutcliffiella sp. NC1 TaxID=3004096 RepID=UPI0022DE400D|nr:glycerophosphodiester phosphodiesterase [Sutcliffiella sp. NC1]WBL12936.1 glycerophosphodiester phosphodiesterase [Sutcliffiella sp. NC1]